MRPVSIILLASLALSSLNAQSNFESAQSAAQTKLDDAVARMTALHESIKAEKLPLSAQRETLFTTLRTVRRDADRSQRMSDNQSADLSALEANNVAQEEVVDYVVNLSAEYVRTLDSQFDPSERKSFADLVATAENASNDPYITPVEKLKPQLAIIEAALKRAQALEGGATYKGEAIMPSGLFEQGTFARFGPITYFATLSGEAGISRRGESSDPEIIPILKGSMDSAIAQLTAGEMTDLPTDSTLGNAIAIAATKESLIDHVDKGGLWVWPILAFAAASLIVGCFKAIELYTLSTPKDGTLGEILGLLAEGKKAEAAKIAHEAPGAIGGMLAQGVRYSDQDPELVEEIMYERIVETQPKVMRLLPFISVTAAVAPLLGLLGTVTGMINTFKLIEVFGAGDAKKLSGGISEALITTEFGLIVAIPSLLIYALLSRKAKSYLARMEKQSISFINGLKSRREDKVA